MSLFLNTPSRFVIAFLPRSNHLLISWLQSPSAVILEPKKIKSVIVSIFSPSNFHEAGGPRRTTPRSRSGGVVVRRYPSSKVRSSAVLCWSSHEEILHVQGKRNPSKMVGAERGHQREDRLKPQSQKTSQSDHMGHSFV